MKKYTLWCGINLLVHQWTLLHSSCLWTDVCQAHKQCWPFRMHKWWSILLSFCRGGLYSNVYKSAIQVRKEWKPYFLPAEKLQFCFHAPRISPLLHSLRNSAINLYTEFTNLFVYTVDSKSFLAFPLWPFQRNSYLQNCDNLRFLTSMSKRR